MLDTAINILTFFGLLWIKNSRQSLNLQKNTCERLQRQIEETSIYDNNAEGVQKDQLSLETIVNSASSKPQGVALLVRGIDIQQTNFQRILNAVEINSNPDLGKEGFLEGATGGEFEVKFQGKKVKVDLRQCNIELSLLKEKRRKLMVLPDQEATYQQVTYNIRPFTSMIIVGSLVYSLESKQLQLAPSFLLTTITSAARSQILESANRFIRNRISQIIIKKTLLTFTFLGILLLRRGVFYNFFKILQRWGLWIIRKQRDIEQRREVYARSEDHLKCRCGKTLSMIFECGHLASCEVCFEEQKRCRICGTDSKEGIRVYT